MKVILTESELIHLLETAMDLDIYSQINSFSSGNGNEDLNDAINQILDNFNELLYLTKSGKEISQSQKNDIYQVYDIVKNIYNQIKYSE